MTMTQTAFIEWSKKSGSEVASAILKRCTRYGRPYKLSQTTHCYSFRCQDSKSVGSTAEREMNSVRYGVVGRFTGSIIQVRLRAERGIRALFRKGTMTVS